MSTRQALNYPKVSVIISTYNRPQQLDKALCSVYEQTFKDFEVIVVDDCTPGYECPNISNHAADKWTSRWGINYAEYLPRDIENRPICRSPVVRQWEMRKLRDFPGISGSEPDLDEEYEFPTVITPCGHKFSEIDTASKVRTILEKWYAQFEEREVDMFAFKLGENSGYQCAPKNRGVEQARGDYIAYLDDDNTWRPDHLEVCVEAIESDLSTDLVYTRACYHIESEDLKQSLFEKYGRHPYPDGDGQGVEWNPDLLNRMNYVDTSCMLHSKGAFWRLVRETGYGWDETLRRFGDWNLVWRWACHGLNGKLVNKVTLDYNVHKDSMQVTRPAMEIPVCFNYASYQGIRADRNAEISLVS